MDGFCIYCGQASLGINADSSAEANERATDECDCPEAKNQRKKKRQIAEAKRKIAEVFLDDGLEYEPCSEVLEMMNSAVELMAEGVVKSMTMSVANVGIAKIAVNSKGGIVVERRRTISKREVAESGEV